jgi:hypothetical protein
MVADAGGGGGGTSGSIGPIERHPADPGQINGQARTLAQEADRTIDQRAVTENAFSPAIANWDGIAAPELRNSPEPVKRSAQEVATNLAWLQFPLQRWAQIVTAFNGEVDRINSSLSASMAEANRATDPTGEPASGDVIAEKRQNAHNEAVAAWHRAFDQHITPGQGEVAGLISRGPTPDNLRRVAGIPALGWAPFALFRDPGNPGMPMVPPPLTGDDGRRAAEMIQRSLNGRAGPEEFRNGMELLRMVTDHAHYAQQHGLRLSDNELAFLTAFYGTLGRDVFKLPGYINADKHDYDENGRHLFGWGIDHADGYSDDDQRWMLAAAGTGILALSDERMGGGFVDDRHRYGLPRDTWDLLHNPAIKVSDEQAGTAFWISVDDNRLGDFGALADMVHAAPSDMHGGTRFSELVTERSAEIASVLDRYEKDPGGLHTPGVQVAIDKDLTDWSRDDRHLRDLLDVSTRNHEANYNLLTGKTHDPMTRVASTIGDQNTMLNDRQFLVSSLFGREWSDDGRAAGGLVDWIGDDSLKPGEAGAHAREAYIDLTNLSTDTTKFEVPDGRGGHTDKNFFTMMAEDFRQNPAVSTAYSRAAMPNMDLFAHPLDSGDSQWNRGDPQLSDHDASRMMMLSQYTPEGRNQITIASTAYKYDLMNQVASGQLPQETAGQYAGNVDGYATAGAENAIWQKNVGEADRATEEAKQAYFDRVMYTNVVKGFVSFGAGQVPGAGPYLSQVVDRGGDLLTGTEFRGAQVVQPEQLPQDLANTPLHTPQGAVNYGAYDLAAYAQTHGGQIPPEATWLDSTGHTVATDAHGHPRVADPLEVTSPEVKAQVAAWAREHYRGYMDNYDVHANDVYVKNAHTGSPEDIRNYMNGGR